MSGVLKYIKKGENYFLYLFLIINVLFLLFYVVFTFKQFLSSDAAVKLLLASEILKSGSIIPGSWYYANGDIWIFFLQFPLIFIGKLMGVTWGAYISSSVVYLSIYLFSCYFFIKQLEIKFSLKMLMLIMSISAMSWMNSVYFFGELTGINIGIFIFTLLGVCCSLEKITVNRCILLLIGVLIFVLSVGNPGRSIIYFIAPFFISMSLIYYDSKSVSSLKIMFVGAVSFILSCVIYYLLLKPNVLMVYGVSNISFASFEEVIEHIKILFIGIAGYFNLIGSPSVLFISFNGGIIFFNLLVLLFAIVGIRNTFKCQLKEIKLSGILSALFIYYSIVIGYLYIFTNPLAVDGSTFRYFRPLFYLGMVLFILFLNNFDKKIKTACIYTLLIFFSISNFNNFIRPAYSQNGQLIHNKHQKIADYLVKNNLRYGFSSYWHAGVTTVLTENHTLVAPVHLLNFTPFKWLSSEDWYHHYEIKNSFLILTLDEYKRIYSKIKNKLPKSPKDDVYIDNFIILVFDYNIALALNRVYTSSLEEGIDFTNEGFPQFITLAKGFSTYEKTHRWTEGKEVSLEFSHKLPNAFVLKFVGTPFSVNINQYVEIEINKMIKKVLLKEGFNTYAVKFENVNDNMIKFKFPNSSKVYRNGVVVDSRELAFAFTKVQVLQ